MNIIISDKYEVISTVPGLILTLLTVFVIGIVVCIIIYDIFDLRFYNQDIFKEMKKNRELQNTVNDLREELKLKTKECDTLYYTIDCHIDRLKDEAINW